jgi:hypothetical protein
MHRIVEIAKKSNQYIAKLNDNIVRVIEANDQKMIDLNRRQMIGHTDAIDKPLIHSKTGSAKLSKAYAKRKGKDRPDLLDTGAFHDGMSFIMPSAKEYFIGSKDSKTTFLAKNYGSIFGISPKNQPKAQTINDKAIINDYLKAIGL